MIVKFQKINDFMNTVQMIKRSYPQVESTKLGYALNKVLNQCQKITNEMSKEMTSIYNDMVRMKELEIALVGSKGEVLYDQKGEFIFDREGLKKSLQFKEAFKTRESEFVKEKMEQDFEITPWFVNVKDIPNGKLKVHEADALIGFVFDENTSLEDFEVKEPETKQ